MKGRRSQIVKTIGVAFVLLALVLNFFRVNANEAFDTNKAVELTIDYRPDGTASNDVEFSIYKVADVDANARFTWYGDFKKFDGNIELSGLNQEGWRNLGLTLKGYVDAEKISATKSNKTSEGTANFTDIEQGLYLVVGEKHNLNEKVYFIQPSMVCLPQYDENGAAQYEVMINPKYDCEDLEKLKIVKIWVNTQPRERGYVEVDVYCDGELYQTVTLNNDNNWQQELLNLEKGHEWTVAERIGTNGDWQVRVERNQHIFEVENKIPETPDETPTPTPEITPTPTPTPPPTTTPPTTPPPTTPPEIPHTGLVWWPVPVFIGVGFMLIVIGLFLKRYEDGAQE